MATRRTYPIPQRDPATVQMANNCERHVRILQEQVDKAREMTKLAHDMVVHAISMRKAARRVLP
jgi:hypothetical protein